MKNKIKPELKKVKVDEHIRDSKKGNNKPAARGRGRPRKNPEQPGPDASGSGGRPPHITTDSPEIAESISAASSPAAEVVPVYDTTEEAKAFLRTPFDLAAGLTQIQALSLYPTQLEAMAPSFKVIYDKYIKPNLGEYPEIWAFGVVAIGVVTEKVQIFREAHSKQRPEAQPNKTDSSGYPSVPTNQNPIQMSQ